ncbi:flagellar basal body-associated protein FliL [Pseudomonas sp. SZ57]|uniref:Flagellar protein FliL n=1 Tax=Pseudomonas syringae pv. coryli TaxID=317659 RepID=A0A0N8R8X5_9PSED|nr:MULTISPECIES: flagellar basal body-associated protein FliL [Pseudomonas]MQQ37000.1 flagellar basal body-associated protein FliL [Pseudomonas sp. SZ57]KPX04807.1 Flagellar basal body-associated protein FliL-like protein [Pseudomonas syringae pv. coryli]MCL6310361.1 flagellar basal body-associated protein FliL [Pseudomonas syringae]MDF7794770.1 flagellar basal body-associated protein FliL [Pseudomonas syringae]POP76045.1 flagellar basal body-associated protein FliL [Pseudomonas syringae pv. s
MKAWILMLLALSLPVMAQEEAKEEGGAPKAAYVSLTPPFVGNYALDGGPKLRVYKADIALRVTGADAEAAVKRNDALIRNQLVSLFTQQTVDSMSSAEAKENIRQEALKQVQRVMNDEEGKPIVEDLLFNNFIVQ